MSQPELAEAVAQQFLTPELIRAAIHDHVGESFTAKELANRASRIAGCARIMKGVIGAALILREAGLFQPVPNLEGRQIPIAEAWNAFLRKERINPDLFAANAWPQAVTDGILQSIGEGAKDLGTRATRAELGPIIEAAVTRANLAARGEPIPGLRLGSAYDYETGEFLDWKPDALFAPVLTQFDEKSRAMRAIPPLPGEAPIRMVELHVPSGELVVFGQANIPGLDIFEDAWERRSGAAQEEFAKACFEEHGLLFLRTGDCYPAIYADNGHFRAGGYPEDHDALQWPDNPDGIPAPPALGDTVRSQARGVWLADMDRLLELHAPEDRDRVAADLRAGSEAATVLQLAAGQVLQIYSPQGTREEFAHHFRSSDLSGWPFMRDDFLIATSPVATEDGMVEAVDWRFRSDPVQEDDGPQP